MKKKLLCGFVGLSFAVSGLAFADSQFPCPNPSNNEVIFTTNMALIYAPNLTNGMPANLMGPGIGFPVNVAWDGMINGGTLLSPQTSTIKFSAIKVLNNVPECHYLVSGYDYHNPNQPIGPFEVVTTPGNSNSANLYQYSLTSGTSVDTNIATLFIAKSK